jgi:hypothetical protein
MGDISKESGQHTLARQKNIQKNKKYKVLIIGGDRVLIFKSVSNKAIR